MTSISKKKKMIIGLLSLGISVLLILSIPLINFWITAETHKKKEKVIPNVTLKKVQLQKKKERPKRKLKRPKPKKPSRTRLKSGPRFAMDLAVAGASGVNVDMELTNRSGSRGGSQGDVDDKPMADFPPPFRLPREAKNAEQDAYVVLSFCVDVGGRAFEIKVIEEKPVGLGLGRAGKEALSKTRFSPAMKDGAPVSFCGLEQPFEIKFDG